MRSNLLFSLMTASAARQTTTSISWLQQPRRTQHGAAREAGQVYEGVIESEDPTWLAGWDRDLPRPVEMRVILASEEERSSGAWKATAEAVGEALHSQNCLCIKGDEETRRIVHNNRQVWLGYFARPLEDKLLDARPQDGYATGLLPHGIEAPRNYSAQIPAWMQQDPQLTPMAPVEREIKEAVKLWLDVQPDALYGYLVKPPPEQLLAWLGERLQSHVLPYCRLMRALTMGIAAMLEYSWRLTPGVFTQALAKSNHLFYPTGVDIAEHLPSLFSEDGQDRPACLFGFHNDFSFLTFHGMASHPGLYIWNEHVQRRIPIRYPEDHILVQTGRQLEWYTGGYAKAQWHEVAIRGENIERYRQSFRKNGSLVRTALPWFAYMPMSQAMQPVDHFATPEAVKQYPAVRLGDTLTEYIKQKFGFVPPPSAPQSGEIPAGFALPSTFKGHEVPKHLSVAQSASQEGYHFPDQVLKQKQ